MSRARRACWLTLLVIAASLLAAALAAAFAQARAPQCDREAHRRLRSPLGALPLPLIAGHRGSSVLCAGNTLECYALALEEGARALEADLQVPGDGSLVMFHDDNALAVTGEDHDLLDIDRASLEVLDAGWGFTPDDGETFPLRRRTRRSGEGTRPGSGTRRS